MSIVLPPVGEIMKTVLRWSQGGNDQIFNRLYWRYAGAVSGTNGTLLWAEAIMAALKTWILPRLSNAVWIHDVTATDLTSHGNAEVTFNEPLEGGVAGQVVPPGDAVLLSFGIDRRYKGGHPRIYIPGMTEAGVDLNGDITSSEGSIWQSAWQNFFNDVASLRPWTGMTNCTHVSVGYFSGSIPMKTPSGRYKNVAQLNPKGTQVDTIRSIKIGGKIVSQRRRARVNA